MKKTKKIPFNELINSSPTMEFLSKTSLSTKKLLTSISKTYTPRQLEEEFQCEGSEFDENRFIIQQSKIPQLIELISYKPLEFLLYNLYL